MTSIPLPGRVLAVCVGPPVEGTAEGRIAALAGLVADVGVTLAVPAASGGVGPPGVALLRYGEDGAALREAVSAHEILLVAGQALHRFTWLAHAGLSLVVDLASVPPLDELAWRRGEPAEAWRDAFSESLRILNELLRAGDLFLCDTEARRDLALGLLLANHRVNPHTAPGGDPSRLLAVVRPDAAGVEPLRAFCRAPMRAPDLGLYEFDAERVASDRAAAIESLLEFNYWHESSVARGEVIVGLEARVRELEATVARLGLSAISPGLLARSLAWLSSRGKS